jgi:aminoglycoside phosphotransferase (APT) family kinase protein
MSGGGSIMNRSTRAKDVIDEIVSRLHAACRRRFGGAAEIENVDVATLGGSNRTILFDLVDGPSRRRLVFRQETYRSSETPFISPHDQFELLNIAYRHDIPVPEPVFEVDAVDELDRGYVVSCVEGETMPKRLLSDPAFENARKRFSSQAGEILARLHAIPAQSASFLEHAPDSVDPLTAQIARFDSYGEDHPALEMGFRWLQTHRPDHGRGNAPI